MSGGIDGRPVFRRLAYVGGLKLNSDQFCYWLNGYFEIHGAGRFVELTLDNNQVKVIKDHLALVLNKVTPLKKIGTYSEIPVANSTNVFPPKPTSMPPYFPDPWIKTKFADDSKYIKPKMEADQFGGFDRDSNQQSIIDQHYEFWAQEGKKIC